MEDTTQALFDEFKDTSNAVMGGTGATTTASATMTGTQRTAILPDGEDPPFDIEAT